jgi:hypothetical protein
MSLTGGKRKVNKSLKAWVAFVKKVQREEKLSYKDAIHRAKQRKDKGEKWMKGGNSPTDEVPDMTPTPEIDNYLIVEDDESINKNKNTEQDEMMGGRRRRRTMRRSRGRGRGRTSRRGRSRSSRRY